MRKNRFFSLIVGLIVGIQVIIFLGCGPKGPPSNEEVQKAFENSIRNQLADGCLRIKNFKMLDGAFGESSKKVYRAKYQTELECLKECKIPFGQRESFPGEIILLAVRAGRVEIHYDIRRPFKIGQTILERNITLDTDIKKVFDSDLNLRISEENRRYPELWLRWKWGKWSPF